MSRLRGAILLSTELLLPACCRQVVQRRTSHADTLIWTCCRASFFKQTTTPRPAELRFLKKRVNCKLVQFSGEFYCAKITIEGRFR